MSSSESNPATPALQALGVTRRFPGVTALDSVDLDVRAGEVHALMGQNGAGKSTLLRVITGALRPDAGTMTLDGKGYAPHSPPDAQSRGVAAVHQEVGLVPALSVAENLFLARFPRRRRLPFLIDRRETRRRAAELLALFHLSIDPGAPLGSFPVAIRQVVAIARAIDMRARLLILDEPTSSLGPRETDDLFATIARLKAAGLAIIFVTHFLDQVYRVADRITILRSGRRVGTFDAPSLPRGALVAHMLGRDLQQAPSARESASSPPHPLTPSPPPPSAPVLRARNLSRRHSIHPFSLELRSAEVVGLAGLLGSGRTEIARLLFAADRPDAGSIEIDGRPARLRSPRDAIRHGIAFCPEDRRADGLFLSMSVRDNIAMVVQRTLSRWGLARRRAHRRIADDLIARLGIATPDADRPAAALSGGNQQKAVLARWLAADPRILLLDEPTRGIDAGAKPEIERLIRDLAARAMAVLFISSEPEEVVRVSDRALVLRDRRVVGELPGDGLTEAAVMGAIAGAPP